MLRARVVREIRSLRGNVKSVTITFARQLREVGSARSSSSRWPKVNSMTKSKSSNENCCDYEEQSSIKKLAICWNICESQATYM